MLQPWFDIDVLESGTLDPIDDVTAGAIAALSRPRGGRGLSDLADAAVARDHDATAVIAVTDLTRACPDAMLVPPLLDELNAGGIPDAQITVIVAG